MASRVVWSLRFNEEATTFEVVSNTGYVIAECHTDSDAEVIAHLLNKKGLRR